MAHLHVIIFLTTPWFFALFISLETLYTEINCKSSPKCDAYGCWTVPVGSLLHMHTHYIILHSYR